MIKFIRYHDYALPAPLSLSANLIEHIIERLHEAHPAQTSFLTAEKIRSVADSVSYRLKQLSLPLGSHRGAVFKYVERGGNADALVRPVVTFEIRYSDCWMLTKIYLGNHFVLEALPHGLRLTSAQQAVAMRLSIAKSTVASRITGL